MRLARTILGTPLGDMVALASPEGLCALEFIRPEGRLTRLEIRLRRWFPPHEIVETDAPALAGARTWLAAYFDGRRPDGDGVPLDLRGAPFERRVWTALGAIPAGTTTSYGAIAKAIGSPGAARAVGAANGANPIALIVPCHRVIGAAGSLVGYGGGLDKKTWLIEHERRWRADLLF